MRRAATLAAIPLLAAAAGCAGADRAGEAPPAAANRAPATAAADGPVTPIVLDDDWVAVALASEEVVIAAELEGQVRTMAVQVGDRVEVGGRLGSIDAREVGQLVEQARASLTVLEAEHRRHQIELEAVTQQYERRQGYEELYSVEEIAELLSRRKAGEAAVAAAAARVEQERAYLEQLRGRLSRSELVAPIAGTVSERYLDPGALVRPGTPVIRLISSGPPIARFAVPPDEAAGLKVGQAVEFRTGSPEVVVPGVVSQVAPDVDAAAQMVFAEATLDPGAELDALQTGTVGAVRPAGAG